MRLLMLGNNNCSEEMLDYAKSQGIYTIATDFLMPETSRTKLKADEYWMVDTSDIDTLEQKCRKHSIDAVICGISEFNQDMVGKRRDNIHKNEKGKNINETIYGGVWRNTDRV